MDPYSDTNEEMRILDQRIKVRDLDEDQNFTFEMVSTDEFANDLIILVPNTETNDEAYLQVVKRIDRENENIISVNGILKYIISVSDGQNNTNQIEVRRIFKQYTYISYRESLHNTRTGFQGKPGINMPFYRSNRKMHR